jgi:hypothetical protein
MSVRRVPEHRPEAPSTHGAVLAFRAVAEGSKMMAYRFGSWTFMAAGGVCLALAAGCSSPKPTSAAPAGDCGQVQPCGGDIVGTWKIVSACLNLPDGGALGAVTIDGQTCQGVTASSPEYTVQGTITFDSSMQFEETLTLFGESATVSIPASCFPGMTCAELGAQLDQGVDAAAGALSASCTGTTTCECTTQTVPFGDGGTGDPSASASGTYTIAGTMLTLTTPTDAGIGESSDSYCVAGGELHLIGVSTTVNMGAMGTMAIESDLVAVRQ